MDTVSQAAPTACDKLSNVIREVDGSNSMGAGALAEAILGRRQDWDSVQTIPALNAPELATVIAALDYWHREGQKVESTARSWARSAGALMEVDQSRALAQRFKNAYTQHRED